MRDIDGHRRPVHFHQRRLSEEPPGGRAGRRLGQSRLGEKSRVYVPSMIVKSGYLYAVLDAGTAKCWKSDTGDVVWEGRLGGTFTLPVLVGDICSPPTSRARRSSSRPCPTHSRSSARTSSATRSSPRRPSAATGSYMRVAIRNKRPAAGDAIASARGSKLACPCLDLAHPCCNDCATMQRLRVPARKLLL